MAIYKQEDMFYNEIGLCAQKYISDSKFNCEHCLKGLSDHFKKN